MSQTSRTITRRQLREKKLLEIINSKQACQSAEIARFERWAKEFHREPPMVELEVTTPDGVPTEDIVKVLPYVYRNLERQCAKEGFDPSDYLSQMTESLLDILKNSEEARGALFKGRASSENGSDGSSQN